MAKTESSQMTKLVIETKNVDHFGENFKRVIIIWSKGNILPTMSEKYQINTYLPKSFL